MRIAIDLQACQSTSRDRGIGRFSLALARAMMLAGAQHEFWLLLNDGFPETIPTLEAQFDGLIPRGQIKIFSAPRSVSKWNFLKFQSRRLPHPTREAVVAEIAPDVMHIASLFESDLVISPVGGNGIPTAVTLYDLIPLVHADHYLDRDRGADARRATAAYHAKVAKLKRADLLLAISNHSRMEAIDYLDWPPEKIVHCGIGIDERFQPLSLTPEAQRCLRSAVGLDRPFIMYTGGIDWRKNMEGLIEAFALLPPAQRAHYQLAIVCAVLEDERRALLAVARRFGLAARDVVLTGFVPDTDLIALYNLCELFVFPSFHEGFGLPVAEAMACGAAVIGANATSVPEVIGRPDALFDPTRPQAIADAIAAVLNNEEFRQSLRRYGLVQARRYTWEKAAIHALTALEALPTSMAGRRAGPVSTEPRIQESTPATT